jgi:hypothetical protein
VRPGPKAALQRAESYRLILWSLRCRPDRLWDEIKKLLDLANQPASLRSASRSALLPPAHECRAALLEWVREALDDLRLTEDRVLREVDGPSLGNVNSKGAVINDPKKKARQFERAGREYCLMLYHGLNMLEAMRRGEARHKAEEEGQTACKPRPARLPRRGRPRVADIVTPAADGGSAADEVPGDLVGEVEITIVEAVIAHEDGVEVEFQNEPSSGPVEPVLVRRIRARREARPPT